ncbi:hypothetical protein FOVG_19751 [Fusarium oxysporum f. sp. pisi HDV247]|uniref:Uncharacterized protein n=1 Tax=Fusarium oxysporum f. sp. pisi HDV247 TaxID=1080344 RepID=W9NF91_FUSOX|nr:hypothetical protein FOVG_19860 [Fusarium oxysporum f. sp. pisi HDV247]EXA28652.1 hypothetical protein FOVG_19751 [Fusarium oxysporum f. sp. pisi HDV247]
MDKLGFESLINLMKGKDSTHQWDVVVSYDTDKVNEILQESPINKLESMTYWGHAFDNDDEGMEMKHLYKFDVELPTPRLHFYATSRVGSVTLSAELKGKFQLWKLSQYDDGDYPDEKDPKWKESRPKADVTGDLAPGYKVNIDAELRNVEGSGKAPDAPADYTVHLEDSPDASRKICISFKKTTVTLKEPDASERLKNGKRPRRLGANLKTALVEGMQEELNQNHPEHLISGVSRKTADDSMITLRTSSFRFSIIEEDKQNKWPGILIMWIGVEGGYNNGLMPGGRTPLDFNPDGNIQSPVPKGCSASVIFSHDIFARKFFVENLKNGFDEMEVKSTIGIEGMKLQGKLKSGAVKIDKFEEKWAPYGALRIYTCDGLEFKPNDTPTEIALTSGINAGVEMNYKAGMKWAYWRHQILYFPPNPGPNQPPQPTPMPVDEKGWVEFWFSWGSKGTWQGGNKEFPNSLRLDFQHDSMFDVKMKGHDIGGLTPKFLDDLLGLKRDKVPHYYSKMQVPLPDANLEMKGLNYFLTTHLLFPGKQVFFPHDLSDDNKAKGMGMAIPRDLILTGDIKSS